MDKLAEQLHYDLSFLNIGEPWPPKEDATRLLNYNHMREQFEVTPEDQLRKVLPDGLLDLSRYEDFISSTRLLGYPRLLTLKTTDMVLGQPPQVTAQGDDAISEKIKTVREESALNSVLRKALIDYSRFGVFLFRAFKDERGIAQGTSWDPREWFPVFYPDGTYRIKHNVLGWVYKDTLTLQIHDTLDGRYEERVCTLSSGLIAEVKSSKVYNKTTNKQLLFAVTNTPTSTNPLGTNDYEIFNGLLQKAIQRLQAILRVLDEHADPSMTGPHALLTQTESGTKVFYTSKYYAHGKDEDAPAYLTWDGKLDSSFKAFEALCEQIYILSEMGEAFLGAKGGSGNVVSGTALRFKLISPLEKARRVQNALTEPLKDIISTLMFLAGHEVDSKKITIGWKDSLPKDPRETAELTRLESGAPAIKPLRKALADNYDLDRVTTDKYVNEILEILEKFKEVNAKEEDDPINPTDGRSKSATKIDTREQKSIMNPASSENHSEDRDGEA